MEFGNPIVGSEDLIREAIKSPNFNTDPESGNVTGWRIARDGSATFYNLTIGSTNFNIDENGNAVFQTVSANDIFLNGESVGDLFTAMPKGILGVTTSTSDTSPVGKSTFSEFNSIDVPDWDASRQIRIGVIARFNVNMNSASNGPTFIRVTCKYEWNGTVTDASPILFELQESRGTAGNDSIFAGEHVINNPAHGGDTLSLKFYFDWSGGDATPTVNYQGTSYGRVWFEDVGPAVTYGDWTPSTPPVQQYTKTYTAQWSESYQGDGSSRGSFDNGHCFQGYYSSTNGNQFSLVGLPESTIVSDLTGATIIKTEIYLDNQHFYSNGGGTVYVGTHEYASAPSNASLSNVRERLDSESFSYNQAKWFTVTNTIATDFLNNSAKGIAIGPAPSNSQSYYSYFSGAGESNPPKLRITYSK